MDILYLLIPLSVGVVLAIIGVFAWALHAGQFDDLEQHGEAIFAATALGGAALDAHQAARGLPKEESARP